jgi:tetratricopeptide (TPR) repeat protein
VWTHEPERALVYADELLRVDPLSPEALAMIGALYLRLGRLDDAERMIVRLRSIDPHHNQYLIFAWNLARTGGDLVTAMSVNRDTILFDTDDPENFSLIAMHYFDLGDVAVAESWNEAALRLDSEASYPMAMAALLHLYRDEDTEAVAIARKLARQGSDNRWGAGGIALRILAASDLAAGNYEGIIARTLTHYPELADARFRSERLGYMTPIGEALMVTLDLASAYLHAGQEAEAESLLSLIEFELPHWATASLWGHGIADAELHALRGEKAKALAALQKHAETGLRDQWRWQLLYSPNLESIRDTPEYQAMVAEIEADMAAQLARVREMERNGELEPIPEVSATTQ